MIAYLILAFLPQQADWISTVTVPESSPPPAVAEDCVCANCDCEDLSAVVIAHEQEIADLKAAVEELRQKHLATKVTAPVDLSGILREIAELKARPAFTEAEIRAFAKDEIEKFHAEVKLKDGTTQKVEATDVKVSVNGFSGQFEVPPGGVITHINGVPVGSNNGWTRTVNPVTRQTTSVVGQTPRFNVRAVPRQGGVRFFAAPRGTCQIVNGVQVCN